MASRDVKLMTLGNGRVGKTQFCRRLRGEEFDETIDSTHGIVVASADLNIRSEAEPVRLHIWDFGGQDIYHGTHALFMRANAVFALIWTPELEDRRSHIHNGMEFRNQPLRYWVDYTSHLGGKNLAALIVQTRCDQAQDKALCPVPETMLHDAFGFYELRQYSARTDRGRAALDETLGEAVAWLHERQGVAQIGLGRYRVKVELERMRDEDSAWPVQQRRYRTISQEQLRQICIEQDGPSETRHFLAYLHNAGIVFYREGLFDDRIILDQGWALEAIYAVFHRDKSYQFLHRQGGRFTRTLLELLVWKDYRVEEQELFLGMMRSCGVCFVHKPGDAQAGIEAEYIAPDLLPDKETIEAELAAQWDAEQPAEEAAYDYDLLHPGLIRAIISRIGAHAGVSALYWQSGVCVYERQTRSHALIEQETGEGWSGRIHLRTQGGRASELLARLSLLIEEEQSRIGLVARETKEPKRHEHVRFVREDESGAKQEPQLDFGAAPADRPRYYVSYAWNDASPAGKDRETIVDRLCAEAKARGTPILRDKTALRVGDRISKFMKEIGKGDRIFVILSDKYLKSPFCMFELFEIWRNCRNDEKEFLEHVRLYTLGDAEIWRMLDRIAYAEHWKNEHDGVDAALERAGASLLGEADFRKFKLMQDFAHHVGDILELFADVVQPRSFEDLRTYGFDDPPPT